MPISRFLRLCLAEWTGEAAYARYLAHHAVSHLGEAPLDRKAFFRLEEERKAASVRRCC